ncbi:class E basic helix-loop-helix protein 22 isoform X2 [Scyliorhinus canicula]|uniref:class E basic helix-loop-helix protein 22 isoform X2 n=1 Tax=Scyliorhinus canicula TaxID=7830 RepID=UPI0018F285C8|nr:class E basic helix-loop-helix protein 22 isoform X2 [Scyliorhinus canicula]
MERSLHLNASHEDLFHQTLSASAKRLESTFRPAAALELSLAEPQSPMVCFEQAEPEPVAQQPGAEGIRAGSGKYSEQHVTSCRESSGGDQSVDDDSDERCELLLLRQSGSERPGSLAGVAKVDGGTGAKKNKEQRALRLSINARERRRMHDLNDALDELRKKGPFASRGAKNKQTNGNQQQNQTKVTRDGLCCCCLEVMSRTDYLYINTVGKVWARNWGERGSTKKKFLFGTVHLWVLKGLMIWTIPRF